VHTLYGGVERRYARCPQGAFPTKKKSEGLAANNSTADSATYTPRQNASMSYNKCQRLLYNTQTKL
jgi:hypothetical protein